MWRAEDIFFGALGGGGRSGTPITRPDEITAGLDGKRRCLARLPVHARHRPLVRLQHVLRWWHRRDLT